MWFLAFNSEGAQIIEKVYNIKTHFPPHTNSQLIIDKGCKNIQWQKDSLLSKWCWESRTAARQSVTLEHTLTPYTKINSKWLNNLNIRRDTIKLLKENTGETFSDINHTNVFLGQSPKAIEIKAKNLKMRPRQKSHTFV